MDTLVEFLISSWNVCCVFSLKSPNRGDPNEYTQHTIILLKFEKTALYYFHLSPNLAV